MPLPDASYHPFIVSVGIQKVNSKTRKLIRRHVMLGKNRGKSRVDETTGSEISLSLADTDAVTRALKRYPIPQNVGSDLAFLPLPDLIEPKAAIAAIKFAPTIAKTRFTLGPCLIFDEVDSTWLEHLSVDAPCIQSVILMAQTYFDVVGHRNNIFRNPVHFLKAIQLLRHKLSLENEDAQISDSTIFAVVNLATHARLSGEDKSAEHHMEGIRKIIDLRGGLENVTQPKLLLELVRFDISLALHMGSKTHLPSMKQRQGPMFPYSDGLSDSGKPIIIFEDLDDNVAKSWEVMQGFCSLVNLAAEAHGRIQWETLLSTMNSVVYRLLDRTFDASSVNEAVRLGLLVFSTQAFLQWKLLKLAHTRLTTSYRVCLNRLRVSGSISPGLVSWLLMVGAISVFEQQDDSWLRPWLGETIETCGITSWAEMQTILESFMWIRLLQEEPGKRVFYSVVMPQM